MRRFGMIAAGLILAASSAQAADITRTTDAGKEIMVRHHASLDAGCGGSIPPIDVTQAPAHGKIDIRPERYVMKGAYAGRTDCNGREVDGAAIWYIPAAGYHGPDSFVLTTRYGGGKKTTIATDNVNIVVK